MSTQETNETRYFNLQLTGIAYFNRLRRVKVANASPWLAVTVAAKYGPESDTSTTYVDTKIVGQEAIDLFESLLVDSQPDDKITGHFKVGDLYADSYVDRKSGEFRPTLKGRLLKVTHVRLNGELVQQPAASDLPAANESAEEEFADQAASSDSDEFSEPADESADATPDPVTLDRADPDFESKKQTLKENGYRWDRDQRHWTRSAVAA